MYREREKEAERVRRKKRESWRGREAAVREGERERQRELHILIFLLPQIFCLFLIGPDIPLFSSETGLWPIGRDKLVLLIQWIKSHFKKSKSNYLNMGNKYLEFFFFKIISQYDFKAFLANMHQGCIFNHYKIIPFKKRKKNHYKIIFRITFFKSYESHL